MREGRSLATTGEGAPHAQWPPTHTIPVALFLRPAPNCWLTLFPFPFPTCWRLRMCSTLASSSSWHVLCRRGTRTLPRGPPAAAAPPPTPAAPAPPHTQQLGVLPAVHSRMDWLAEAPGVLLPPTGGGAPEPPGGGSRLSAPGSLSTTRWRVAQPRRCRVKAAGSGGLGAVPWGSSAGTAGW